MTETAQTESASRPAAWQPALEHSRWLCQLLEARPDIINWLIAHDQQPLDRALMAAFLAEEAATTEDALGTSLRRLRQRVMAALVIRDLAQRITLAEVMADSGHYSIDSTTVRAHVSAAGGKGGLIDALLAARGAGSPVSFTAWLMPSDDHSPSI